jgi:outer membrane protein assembly factor BamB
MLIVLAVGVAAVVLMQTTEVTGDRGMANVLTQVLGLVVWWSLFSASSRRGRMLVLAGILAVVAGLMTIFQVHHISGELLPVFTYRWSQEPDELLDQPTAADLPLAGTTTVDLSATKEDFPQFLGPQRNTAVDVDLSRDWKTHPPRPVWRQEIGAGWSAFSVVNGHAVTMEQRSEMELVTCYNVRTGDLEWAASTEARYATISGGVGPRATPTIEGGRVYAQGATGHLQCLDGATGRRLWARNLRDDYHIPPENEAADLVWARSASPLVVDDLVIVPAGGPSGGPWVSLVACDKNTGATVWEGGDRQISYSSPVLATLGGTRQVIIVNEDNVTGHDVRTGRVLWEHPWPGSSSSKASVSQAVPVPPERVFLSKAYGNGASLIELAGDPDGTFTAKTIWANPKVMKTKFTNVAMKDGYVYGLSDGVLECIELDSGRSVWRNGRYYQGQILRVRDLLLVMAESGEVLLIEASPERPNHVLGRFKALEGMTWNNIALYGPYLLVRNAGEAACWELPLEAKGR